MVRYLRYLLWTVCNSRQQSHSGSGEMGWGTEQQQQQQRSAWKTVRSEFSWNYTITMGQTHSPTRYWDSPSSLGRETWPRPAAARSCWFWWRFRCPRCLSSAEGWCSPTAPTPAGDSESPLKNTRRTRTVTVSVKVQVRHTTWITTRLGFL